MKRKASALFLALFMVFALVKAQVNLQTGGAQSSLVLNNYSNTGSRLSLSTTLNYVDGNGLKVSEMAGSEGTGWSLDCGGVITRVQHGEPDDQKQNGVFNYPTEVSSNQGRYDYSTYFNSYYPNGYLYSEYNPADPVTDVIAYVPYEDFVPGKKYKPNPKFLTDREQDVFAFSFNGRSGQFVIGKNKQVKTLNDSKLKIDFTETDMTGNNIRTTISQFTVTDETGIKYVFNNLELGYVVTYDSIYIYDVNGNQVAYQNFPLRPVPNCSNCWDNFYQVFAADSKNSFVVNKWFLTQIINPFTNKTINFNYEDYEVNIDGDQFIDYSETSGKNNLAVTLERHRVKSKRLISVNLSPKEELDLIYPVSGRVDIPGDKFLSQLQVKYNSQIVYSWNFSYEYIVGNTGVIHQPDDILTDNEKKWSRLYLASVQKKGPSNLAKEPPYSFGYNMGGDNRDGNHGAYLDRIPQMFSIFQDYYGYSNTGLFFWFNEPSPGKYFSKGTLSSYAKNLSTAGYKVPYSTVAKNGIIKSITYPLGGSLSFEYEANKVLYSGQEIHVGGVRVSKTILYDGISHNNDVAKEYRYITEGGTCSGWGYEGLTYQGTSLITADNCGQNQTPALQAPELASNFVTSLASSLTASVAGTSTMSVGAGTLVSMGIAIVVAVIIEIIIDASTPSTQSFTVNEYRNTNYAYANPMPNGYSRVEVVDKLLTVDLGKTVYVFSDPTDHAIEVPTMSTPFSSKPRYAPWVYGLPKTITVYDKNLKPIKQSVNTYNYIVSNLTDANYLSRKWTTLQTNFGCFFQMPVTTTSQISQETYYPLVGRTELTQSKEYFYNENNQTNVTTTSYEYDANYQLKHKYFTNSKNELVEIFYRHPYDYSISGAINSLNNAGSNVILPVISSETYIDKSDNNSYLIAGTSADFDILANGDIKPKTLYSFQNASPVISSGVQAFSNTQLVRDPNYFKQTAAFIYDGNGNLVQTTSDGNRIVSDIYDYGGKYVTATVSNAPAGSIAYSSFETDEYGGWTAGTGSAILTNGGITGTNSFSGTLSKTVPAGSYIVTLWKYNASAATVNGQSGTALITIGNWQLLRFTIGSASSISVSGSQIDEVRLYPAGAEMTTTTYSPLIGKTSECDINNRITYYEYDDIGRLRMVKDEQGNIVKMYEYNYKH
jgi:hypothetical protein